MERKDKELLLKDLCGRLLYGVRVKTPYNDATIIGITSRKGYKKEEYYIDVITDKQTYPIRYIKPYLRPMSSMTEEERTELSKRYNWIIVCGVIQIRYHSDGYWDNGTECPTEEYIKLFDWLNEHHFDYRGLINKGLALKAPNRWEK